MVLNFIQNGCMVKVKSVRIIFKESQLGKQYSNKFSNYDQSFRPIVIVNCN